MKNKLSWIMPDEDARNFLFWLPPLITALAYLLLNLARFSPEKFWAFNLWDYLPSNLSYTFIAFTIAVSFPPVLLVLAKSLEKRAGSISQLGAGGRAYLRWIVFALSLFIIFWIFREKRPGGDSYFLELYAERGDPFEIKEAGGSFLFFLAYQLSGILHIENLTIIRFFVYLSGVFFFVFLWKMVVLLFDTPREGWLGILFLCSSGFVLLFFGHIEIYGFLLAAICAYMYFAILFLQRKGDIIAPALLLGISIWFHLSAVFLIPSLIYLIFRRRNEQAKRFDVKTAMRAAFFLVLPFALFLLSLELTGHTDKIMEQYAKLTGFLGLERSDEIFPALMPLFKPRSFRFFGHQVTQYHLFSKNHLLFLFNSYGILCLFAFPVLGALIPIIIKKKMWGDRRFMFLVVAALPMLLYSVVIYPVYWAYDWDLFSATAFCVSILAIYTMLHGPSNQRIVSYLVIYFSLFSLLYMTAPFIVFNSMSEANPAGVYTEKLEPFSFVISTMGNPDVIYR